MLFGFVFLFCCYFEQSLGIYMFIIGKNGDERPMFLSFGRYILTDMTTIPGTYFQ